MDDSTKTIQVRLNQKFELHQRILSYVNSGEDSISTLSRELMELGLRAKEEKIVGGNESKKVIQNQPLSIKLPIA